MRRVVQEGSPLNKDCFRVERTMMMIILWFISAPVWVGEVYHWPLYLVGVPTSWVVRTSDFGANQTCRQRVFLFIQDHFCRSINSTIFYV